MKANFKLHINTPVYYNVFELVTLFDIKFLNFFDILSCLGDDALRSLN